jgi:arylsulfatase A-like enzyme
LGPSGLLALAGWFGLAAGLLEVLAKVICAAIGWHGWLYQMSRHFFWLVPVTNFLIFLILGLFLTPLVWAFPRFGRWLSVRLLGALALLPCLLVAVPQIYGAAWLLLAWGAAVSVAPALERRAAGFRRNVAYSFPVLVVCVLGLAGWVFGRQWAKESREAARPLPPPGTPNVLLVVMDTVRADHLSAYGYGRETTPTLERIAAQGVRFEAARSTAPWTLPSHASMFTGRVPHELDVGYLRPMKLRYPTLAAYLGSRGYATAGFVANVLYCGYDTGLGEGFTHYEDYGLRKMDAFLMARLAVHSLNGFYWLAGWTRLSLGTDVLAPVEWFVQNYIVQADVYSFPRRKDGATINREYLDWLSGRREPERPFFAFLNYYDAHTPYLPPRSSLQHFGLRPASTSDLFILLDWEQVDKPKLPARLKALATDSYDDCIRALDDQLHDLFESLANQGILDNTLVIVTADHGEALGEHDLYVHAESLYEPEVHVPLLIMMPRSRPPRRVVQDTVSLIDLPATVVDLVGLAQGSPFGGRSLARVWEGSPPTAPAISELPLPDPTNPNQSRSPARLGPLTSLAQGPYNYIHRGGHEKEELYRHREDPQERHNLATDASMQPVLARFRNELEHVLQAK